MTVVPHHCSAGTDGPSNLTSIGWEAFLDCNGLSGPLVVPEGVTGIEGRAFRNTGLWSLTLPSTLLYIGDDAFGSFDGHASAFNGSLAIPASVTSIGGSAFYDTGFDAWSGLPSGLLHLGASAFRWCSLLPGDLVIPRGLTSLGSHTFQGCSSLRSLTFEGAHNAAGTARARAAVRAGLS